MTKFAVRSLNQSASQELGPHGINCNVYCPSPVDTPMWTKCDQDIAAMTGTSEGDISREVSGMMAWTSGRGWVGSLILVTEG
jgi:meso-butanediol dehydrogenase/(S,S)-butanediol dehydrogenase/diacetyl reductase